MKKRMLALLLAAFLLLGCAAAEGQLIPILEISKYGNLALGVTGADFMALGFEHGDIITAGIGDTLWELPVCTSYSDVDNGLPVCRVESPEEVVVLALNMDDLATASGVASREKIEEDPGYRWTLSEAFAAAPQVSVSLKEARGYYDEWLLRSLVRSNERGDYAHLSDAAFANFRPIETTGMGAGVLYRSSSPVNAELGRNGYADAALAEAGVRTIINLADHSVDEALWQGSAYVDCARICLNLGMDFHAEDFRSALADGLRFMISGEAPFLIHCNEGKDRAGFVSAVLECLMGAAADEVIVDYMESYYNYFGIQPGTEKYDAIAQSNIIKSLEETFALESLYEADLAAAAEAYLQDIGLNGEEIAALRTKLA